MRLPAGWFPVMAHDVENHSKFVDLALDELGAWMTLRARAELLKDEPFANRRVALHALSARTPNPATFLDRLIQIGLVDVLGDGRLTIHDISEWSGRPPSDEAGATRERKRRQREREREEMGHEGHAPVTTSHDVTPETGHEGHAPIRDDTRQDETRRDTVTTAAAEDRDSLDTYHELTLYRPWGVWSGDKLREAIRDFGDPRVDAALRAEHAADSTRDTLLDRTLARLAREAERQRLSKPKRAPKTAPAIDPQAFERARRELMAEAEARRDELVEGGVIQFPKAAGG